MSDEIAPNELAIIITEDGTYRILVPNEWADDRQIPEFAYLAVAAVLRLARVSEVEFARSVANWAEDNLRRASGQPIDYLPAPKKPRPN